MGCSKVEVVQRDTKWVVRVSEDGDVAEREFHMADHAHSWASGQRARLQSQSSTHQSRRASE